MFHPLDYGMSAPDFDPQQNLQFLLQHTTLCSQGMHNSFGCPIGLAVPHSGVLEAGWRLSAALDLLVSTREGRFPVALEYHLVIPDLLRFLDKLLRSMLFGQTLPGNHTCEPHVGSPVLDGKRCHDSVFPSAPTKP